MAFEASSAVTVKLKAVPAMTEPGAATEKCVARMGGGTLKLTPPPPPHALSSHNPQISNNKKNFFMTPPEFAPSSPARRTWLPKRCARLDSSAQTLLPIV